MPPVGICARKERERARLNNSHKMKSGKTPQKNSLLMYIHQLKTLKKLASNLFLYSWNEHCVNLM